MVCYNTQVGSPKDDTRAVGKYNKKGLPKTNPNIRGESLVSQKWLDKPRAIPQPWDTPISGPQGSPQRTQLQCRQSRPLIAVALPVRLAANCEVEGAGSANGTDHRANEATQNPNRSQHNKHTNFLRGSVKKKSRLVIYHSNGSNP